MDAGQKLRGLLCRQGWLDQTRESTDMGQRLDLTGWLGRVRQIGLTLEKVV